VDDEYLLQAIALFVDAFGGLELQIVAGNNSVRPATYAITSASGNLITLYNTPNPLLQADVVAGRNYALHTAENLVHEFGHVLDIRTGNIIYPQEWELMRVLFSISRNCGDEQNPRIVRSQALGFDPDIGWDFTLRQNKQPLSEFTGCSNPTYNHVVRGKFWNTQ
jgi:hypothetical protein